jgi:hypothetical protein
LTTINVAKGEPGSFERAVAEAKKGDTIIYHVGTNCQKARHRRMAMGAYQAGLVILVKMRLSADGWFSHRAIRTKKPFHPFFEARDED